MLREICKEEIPRKSKSTKRFSLVGSGILYMDHSKENSLIELVLDFQGRSWLSYLDVPLEVRING